ncbi:MAG: hypothetical protein LBK52_01935, partial [Deltaproteobacteria bacterium]|nr:hypothetical protein [Deltaproteobacteria bacterium]
MTKQKAGRQRDSLEKIIFYILGTAPDEFGLLPDREGYVTVRELVGALRQEEGFRGQNERLVRSLVDQALGQTALEIDGARIRVKPPLASLPSPVPAPPGQPKLLYA